MFGIRKRRAPVFGSVAAEDDKDIEVQRARDVARHSLWAEARLLLRDLLFALMFAALLVVFVVQPVKVEGTSMLPRLHDGERIFVNKLIYYGLPPLQRGDIVVFWFPDDPSKSYIKRIIGLPGETVEVREGRIYIRSGGREQLLEEPYIDPQRNLSRQTLAPKEVKPHYYFVMGDNRDASSDSRIWGLVPEKYIYGKALFRYWPLGSASFISHDTDSNIPTPSGATTGQEPADDDQ
ncbi:MAG TPA: signal peptidase I [Pyrinomonadaceae bacterium]|nr:signal peptidase I [Pyrinomonadaceae bacterium]